jgi:hypothetical protein
VKYTVAKVGDNGYLATCLMHGCQWTMEAHTERTADAWARQHLRFVHDVLEER